MPQPIIPPEVRDHYLDYPYPPCKPEDDKRRLAQTQGSYLGEINHYLFNGEENFQNGFRILIAGGGTGDATIYLADQLQETNAEIVYLDFSTTSMQIAQERARNRRLTNITWIEDSLLNIPNLDLGKFDFINCIGVLHHLKDPDAGLQILADSLSDTGGMDIMVYAQYGRTAVYQIQELLRLVNKKASTRQDEVKNAWTILNDLPETNWQVKGKELVSDHKTFGDIGMYDLFLHKQDRAYTIPQLYEFLEKAQLKLAAFYDGATRCSLELDQYIKDETLLETLKQRPRVEQEAMSEILCGNITKHMCYVSKRSDTKASLNDMDNVPYFMESIPEGIVNDMTRFGPPPPEGALLDVSWIRWQRTITVPLLVSTYTKHFFSAMLSKERSFQEIKDYINQRIPISDEDFQTERNSLLVFELTGDLLMRKKTVSIPDFHLQVFLSQARLIENAHVAGP